MKKFGDEMVELLRKELQASRIRKERMVADLQDCNTALQAIIRMQERREKREQEEIE